MKSLRHPHRSAANWLIYDLIEHELHKNASCYGNVVYDLGCGEKPYENFFRQYCSSYVGVDWSGTVHKLKADVIADLNLPLPLHDGIADTVVSLSVLEHLKEPAVMLAEAFRILRPTGLLVLQVPFMWHVHEAPHDYFRFTRYGLTHLLEKAGFQEIRVHALSGVWSTLALKVNYQLVRLTRGRPLSRSAVGVSLIPLLWLTQKVGHWMDGIWPASEGETVGYVATARKYGQQG